MIEIDGSYGEGGGQILRTAIALSAIIGEEIHITNIRRNRPKEGLKPQHLMSIKTAAMLCNAEIKGVASGSTDIYFSPSEIRGIDRKISIGTAGSIPLLMQAIMPMAAFAKKKTKLTINGGTDVAWSPSIDYLKEVTLKALRIMGYQADIKLIERGYYPKGGGVAEIEIEPSKLIGYHYATENQNEKKIICGMSHCSGLPEHVAERQAESAKKILEEMRKETDISVFTDNFRSTGSGITLWSGLSGAVSIGKRGLPAEKVGECAANEMLDELLCGAAVDSHLADQLIPYMGLAGKGSFTVREVSKHCLTNMHITEKMLDVKFSIDYNNKNKKRPIKITVE
ncbi:RNA 3'-terminal phosphate cyclase [Methanolobus bombayensis]|uniref:RNA 3'-terminal phosphate cyclase n=1 Tax=Methanolobus bombayensis TaxID=38023 RepID=UPI001AE18B2D|nr:RNA 3'-terminal phosphate cyclase [Methanolobus bombayensis]MBP1909512.1 RNA 3'-terminal phosphate cyclase (ATP) [Methanolobus bombayensis]